jgi:DNA sulfur modification protein DndC
MEAMIRNDTEKEWMRPLLEFRNEIDFRGDVNHNKDRKRRDFRRMNGTIMMKGGKPIPGPYKQEARKYWLSRVLQIQRHMEENAPRELGAVEIITQEELEEIRRIWVEDKHEIEDILPTVYEKILGRPFLTNRSYTSNLEQAVLEELYVLTKDHPLQYELVRSLLSIEQDFQSMTRRVGIHQRLIEELKKSGYLNSDEAQNSAQMKQELLSIIEGEEVDKIHYTISKISRLPGQ